MFDKSMTNAEKYSPNRFVDLFVQVNWFLRRNLSIYGERRTRFIQLEVIVSWNWICLKLWLRFLLLVQNVG